MKRPKLLSTLFIVIVSLFGAIAIACGGDEKKPTVSEGPETGMYYFDTADGEEYLLSLYGGDKTTFVFDNEIISGTYSKNKDLLTLKYPTNTVGTLNAKVADDNKVITVTYNDADMRFLRRETFRVEFNSNGGSKIATVPVINGKTVYAPTEPVKEGFEFIGWYKDNDSFGKPFVFGSDIITEDIVLYARWVAPVFGQSEFTVDFDLNYDTDTVVESKQTRGGKLYDVVTPVRDGFVFKGWWISMYGDGDRLSYRLTDETVIRENSTLYALWQSKDAADKPAMPVVDVNADNISWGSISNAQKYHVEIHGPEGFQTVNKDIGSTSEAVAFVNLPAGDYVISVTSISGGGAKSDTAVRYYRNKALDRVSLFTVVEPSTLIYNNVAGAEKYLLDIDCGDANHKHAEYDNGLSTSFNFINCKMKEGGIKFTVTAVAEGKASSTSEVFVYNDRVLNAVTGLTYDSEKEEVLWNGVPNAAGYKVKLSCAVSGHDHNVEINVGNKTSVSLKSFDACTGKITVGIVPVTKGYNSPKAAEIEIEKRSLAAPSDVRILGDVLSWDAVAGAVSYEISVGGTSYVSDTNEFGLDKAVNTTWEKSSDYTIRIMAVGKNNRSLWSDAVDARYYAMYSSVAYNGGEVSWRHVIGVKSYNVRVNDGEPTAVNNGANKINVRLTAAGENTVYVNFVDKDGNASEWASVKVFAHTIDFDTRGGSGEAESQYYAIGDKIELPTGLVKTGYDFAGWYTTPLGGEGLGALYDDAYFDNAGGFVLYAYWTPQKYTISFDANGGTVDSDTGTVEYLSDSYKWPVAKSSDSSMFFAGWFSDRNGQEVQYTDENGNALRKWSITRDMTVYACWNSIFSFEKLTNGTYRVLKNSSLFNLAPSNLTIPATYQGPNDAKPVSVTEIGSTSFINSTNLITVNIPNSIRYVDIGAFNGSNNITAFKMYDVEGVKLPVYSAHDGVLYHSAYNDFGVLTSMELTIYPRGKTGPHAMPSGVTLLALNCLASSKVTKLTIPATVTVIERHAIYSCSQLTEIEFEYAGNVTEDGSVLPLNIYAEAIASCSKLTTVKFPARLTEFSPTIFASCNAFADIQIEKGSKDYSAKGGFLCDASGSVLMYCPPATVVGSFTLPVGITTVGEYAFAKNSKITEIIFPIWSREIRDGGFSGCTNLTTVTFSEKAINNFTIGKNAFEKCTKLRNVNFNDGSKVTKIDDYAFAGCSVLDNFQLPDTLVAIGEYAFQGCVKIKSFRLPAKLSAIGSYAFTGCILLGSLDFADNGVDLSIDDYAFNGCTALTEINIPANVISIGDGIFAGCTKLTTINVDESSKNYQTWQGVLFTKGFETMLFYPLGRKGDFKLPDEVKALGKALFKNNASLQSITIGKNVTSIGAEAFMNCTGLQTLIFESGDGDELEIDISAFEGCTNLERVQMTNRIKVIPDRMFYNDKSINSISLPDYITKIGENAFYSCSSITSLTVPATVSKIGYGAFKSCTGLRTLNFIDPKDAEAVSGITYAEELEFIENDKYMSEAFSSCSSLQSVDIPSHVKSIANGLFSSCNGLLTVSIPNTVTYIGTKAFYGCSSLHTVDFEGGNLSQKLTIGESVNGTNPSISTGAFSSCSALTNINLPARIDNIPAYTFYNCRGLINIIIPNSVTNKYDAQGVLTSYAVQPNAFGNCSNLVAVTFASDNKNPVTIGDSAFTSCIRLTTLNLPQNLRYIEKKSESGEDISDYYDIFGSKALNSCSVFSTINVENGGKYHSVDGILYYRDTLTDVDGNKYVIDELVLCPQFRTKAVVIPYYVTNINARAFFKSYNITSFSFEPTPEGETEIELKINDAANEESGAFNQFIGITSLTLPNRLTYIGDYGFYNCSMLHTLAIDTVNSKLKHVGKYAFAKCTGLRSVKVPAKTETIGANAFSGCTKISSFTFEDGAVLKKIDGNAFAETAFDEIRFPDSVTTLGGGLFVNGSVTTVYLPSSLKELTSEVFSGCNTIKSIYLTNNAYYYVEDSVIYSADKKTLLIYPIGKTDVSYDILDSVTKIAAGAFEGNTDLVTVKIPNSVQTIEAGAFYGCTKLTTVNFVPDDEVTQKTSLNIGDTDDLKGVFQDCGKLKNVNLPARTVRLGKSMFSGCVALDGLTIHEKAALNVINANVFTNAGGGRLVLPSTVSTIKSNAFSGSLFTEIVMSGVETIEDNAFKGSNISSVVLPSTLTTIGVSAFASCENLVSVEIKLNSRTNLSITTETKTTVNDTYGMKGTFAACPNLKTVSIATNGVLPYFMFYKCNSLETLTVSGEATVSGYLCYSLAGLKKVSIADSVKSIGNYSFYNCVNLGSHNAETCADADCKGDSEHGFEFVSSVTAKAKSGGLTAIGNYAFQGTAIKSFAVPDTVTSLGTYLFKENKALTNVTLPTYSFPIINTQSFFGCTSLSNVEFVNGATGDERKLVTIQTSAFSGCTSLKSIDLNGFKTINGSAFLGSGLTSVTIPNTVTALNANAFQDCADLVSATIPTGTFTSVATGLFKNCSSLQTVLFASAEENKLTDIMSNAFENCSALSNISFHKGLTTVKDNAFLNSGLTRVELSSTVNNISPKAFAGCRLTTVNIDDNSGAYAISDDNKALLSKDKTTLIRYIGNDENYTIPQGVTTIDQYAFANSGVKTITSTADVKYINDYAFNNCGSLESITFGDDLESIGSHAFDGCALLGGVELPDSLTTLGGYAFANSGIADIQFGNQLEDIGTYAFSACVNLSTVIIPENVKNIGTYAFLNCTGITSITLNKGLETIGASAFEGCSSLGDFTMPDTVTTIGNAAFMDCVKLQNLNIPASVASIGCAAFAGCSELASVKIAKSAEKLVITNGTSTTNARNRGAFADCVLLSSVYFSERPIYNATTATAKPYLANYIFYNCTNLSTCKLHDGIDTVGTNAFQNCLSLSSLTLPAELTVINSSAFRDSGLSGTLTLPSNLLTVGTYAFMDCKLLERVTIPGTVKTLNSAAFAGCLLLESVTFEKDDGIGLGFAPGSTALSFAPSGTDTNRGVFGGCVSLQFIDLTPRSAIYNHATNTAASYKNMLANFIFADCTQLKSVVLPDYLISIGTGSFFNTGLTSFTAGVNVTSIYASAFANCEDLETFVVTKSNTKLGITGGSNTTSVSSLGVFFNCTSLKSMDLTTRPAIYSNATSTAASYKALGKYTFYGCTALSSVSLPSNITKIDGYAFDGCIALTSIDIPNGVTEIAAKAFRKTGLTSVVLPNTVTTLRDSAFRECTGLKSVQLSNSLEYVYKFVFMDCTALESIYIPAGIKIIGNATFAGCTSLKTIGFEESAAPLGFAKGEGAEGEDRGVFADCTSLTAVDLSNINVRRIWFTSYSETSGGYSYTINSAMPEYMFYNCTGLESVILSDVMWFGGGYSSDGSRADYTFGNCTSLKTVKFPESGDFRLGDTSFYNCGFEELTLPGNLAGMGCDAFVNNKKLTKLVVENNSICTYVRGFSGCSLLSDVTLPDTLTGIEKNAFKDCVMLKSVSLPENLEYIDSNAFQGSGLISITVPSGVRMYSYVFADCADLKTVVFGESISNFGWHVFENCTSLMNVTLPQSGLNGISPYTFYGCTSLSTLTLPETVTYISEYAFYGCNNLTLLSIPSDVTEIGDFAFAGCTKLAQIVIPEAVADMGSYVFEGWTNTQTVYVETHASAPEGWSDYWNWNSKLVEVPPETGGDDDGDAAEPVYEIQPDRPCDADIVYGYANP